MTPNQRVFHKEYGAELIRLAEEDLKSARVLLRTQDVRPENGLFHVQQCVEKCLKAVLCHEEKAVPLTHEISVLLMALGNRVPPAGTKKAFTIILRKKS
jgi:HEPN domain-containing protein